MLSTVEFVHEDKPCHHIFHFVDVCKLLPSKAVHVCAFYNISAVAGACPAASMNTKARRRQCYPRLDDLVRQCIWGAERAVQSHGNFFEGWQKKLCGEYFHAITLAGRFQDVLQQYYSHLVPEAKISNSS